MHASLCLFFRACVRCLRCARVRVCVVFMWWLMCMCFVVAFVLFVFDCVFGVRRLFVCLCVGVVLCCLVCVIVSVLVFVSG